MTDLKTLPEESPWMDYAQCMFQQAYYNMLEASMFPALTGQRRLTPEEFKEGHEKNPKKWNNP